ncbi:hypothetical protein QN277_007853 [Acacia crassicarpa]|uniref:Ubiquitin-like protease family profile domain-containing protein n=1 Tax=Acacia crassicarpa TaxID=499986 RepID=A0AAE1MDH2_9FABA|nr:hypothetical protein QN277_007853 [Acacia crassicarpa]
MSQTTMEQRQEYISRRLCNVRRKVYLLPFFHSRHWQLVLMCMVENKVIFLCSTHGEPVPTLVQTINDAMKTFQIDALQKRPAKAKEPKWLRPETRRQPQVSNLCGQYIMKHMHDIVTKGETKLFEKMFQCPAPFSNAELEHIRELFC